MAKNVATRTRGRLNRAERREQIVDAALRTFSRHGYRGATTRELARAAGITEVTIFRHFPSKEKLYEAVLDKYSILPILRAELRKPRLPGSARATLRQIALRFLGILKDRRDLVRLMLSEAAINPRQARMLFRQGPSRFFRDLAELLRRFRQQGEIRAVDPRLASRAIFSMLFTFFIAQEVFYGRESEPIDPHRAVDAFCDILWGGLRPERRTGKGAKRS